MPKFNLKCGLDAQGNPPPKVIAERKQEVEDQRHVFPLPSHQPKAIKQLERDVSFWPFLSKICRLTSLEQEGREFGSQTECPDEP